MDFLILGSLVVLSVAAIGYALWIFNAKEESSTLQSALPDIVEPPQISTPSVSQPLKSTIEYIGLVRETAVLKAPPKNPEIDPLFQRDQFLINQRHFTLSEKYYVYSEQGQPIIFVDRPQNYKKGFLGCLSLLIILPVGITLSVLVLIVLFETPLAPLGILISLAGLIGTFFLLAMISNWTSKRNILFYRNETKGELVLEVHHEKSFLMNTFTVRDPEGVILAKLRRPVLLSLIRRQWEWKSPDDIPFCKVTEDSIILSLLRRVLPFGQFFITNFVFIETIQNQVVAEFNRKFTLFDRYVLDLTLDVGKVLDRRVALAVSILLDTGEKR